MPLLNSQFNGLVGAARSIKLCFIVTVLSAGALLAQSASAQDDISKLVEQSRRDFKPVSERQPAEARLQVELQIHRGQGVARGMAGLVQLRQLGDAVLLELAVLGPAEGGYARAQESHIGVMSTGFPSA